jgi:CheY-like chemotaxis protein
MSVLLVDDNEMVLMTRKLILERYGHRVLTAPNGAAALSALQKESSAITVAVIDYHLPDTNGDKLCQTMKAAHPNLRVILTSGMIPEDISNCPDYVVLKGGSPLELVNKVGSLIQAA